MKAGEKHRAQRKVAATQFVTVPEPMTVMTCPRCGVGVEVWTNREDTSCEHCDQQLFRKQRRDH